MRKDYRIAGRGEKRRHFGTRKAPITSVTARNRKQSKDPPQGLTFPERTPRVLAWLVGRTTESALSSIVCGTHVARHTITHMTKRERKSAKLVRMAGSGRRRRPDLGKISRALETSGDENRQVRQTPSYRRPPNNTQNVCVWGGWGISKRGRTTTVEEIRACYWGYLEDGRQPFRLSWSSPSSSSSSFWMKGGRHSDTVEGSYMQQSKAYNHTT